MATMIHKEKIAENFYNSKIILEDLTKEIALIKKSTKEMESDNPERLRKLEQLYNERTNALTKAQTMYAKYANDMLQLLKNHFDEQKSLIFKKGKNSHFLIELVENERLNIIGPYLPK